ncbi:hypothetical protein ACJX0J_012884 [Zea mays]
MYFVLYTEYIIYMAWFFVLEFYGGLSIVLPWIVGIFGEELNNLRSKIYFAPGLLFKIYIIVLAGIFGYIIYMAWFWVLEFYWGLSIVLAGIVGIFGEELNNLWSKIYVSLRENLLIEYEENQEQGKQSSKHNKVLGIDQSITHRESHHLAFCCPIDRCTSTFSDLLEHFYLERWKEG